MLYLIFLVVYILLVYRFYKKYEHSGVYKLVIRKGKRVIAVYYGESNNILRRWKEHKHELAQNNHHSQKLQKLYNRYGDCFDYIVVRRYLTRRSRLNLERKLTKKDKKAINCL